MYEVKNRIYLDMTKTQKSALCNFLRALVKKSPEMSVDDIFDKFIEDEQYYFEINNPHFEFLQEYLEDETFAKDTILYLKECRKYYDYKKKQEPIIQAQKEFEKKKRAFLREVKMSKDEPTKKQLYYYERLCKKYNIEKKELSSKNVTYINYRTMCGNELRYFQIKAVRTGSWENHHRIVLGFRSVDDEINSEIEKKNLLEAALADANRASEAKSVFLSNMSHDMRTPMNAIVGFTTLALSHIDNKAQVEEYLRKIMASGNHLLELINDVLDMSRIESGKMQLEEKPCNMHKIVRTLENIIHGDAKAKGLELSVDVIDVDDKGFFCDELRVNQILLNLLSNAIKYTNAGGRISFCVTEKPGAPDGFANYEFIIKDTGIGMNEEFVSHIFEPFERERNSTISGIQGTGLGMAITKNIVDMMNGSIEVKSKKDVGTECRVELTFRLNSEVKEQPDDEMQAIQNAVVNKVVDHHNERILLTEDNELNQEIAVAILSEIGFIVEVAGNGQEAVDMLKNSKPGYYRLVLMDVQMPVMNGYEAAMAIRAFDNEEIASIPILAMTANAFEEDKQKAIQSGMNGHIAKPIDIKNLIETIDKVLNT